MQRATRDSVRELLVKNVSRKSVLHTDESPIYTKTGKEFAGHATVIHSKNEYALAQFVGRHADEMLDGVNIPV